MIAIGMSKGIVLSIGYVEKSLPINIPLSKSQAENIKIDNENFLYFLSKYYPAFVIIRGGQQYTGIPGGATVKQLRNLIDAIENTFSQKTLRGSLRKEFIADLEDAIRSLINV